LKIQRFTKRNETRDDARRIAPIYSQNLLRGEPMLLRLKFLPLALALVAVALFGTSCGSSNAKLRVVQAIPDVPSAQPLDIYIDGTKVATSVGFGGAFPGTGYNSTSSGSRHLQVYLSGQTTGPYFDGNITISSGSDYTVVLTGFTTGPSGTVVAPQFTDNNTAPTSSGNFEVRFVHASPTWNNFFGGMDVYVVAPGTSISAVSPTISNLTYKSDSGTCSACINGGYLPAAAGNYEIIMTPVGSKANDIDFQTSFQAGQIRTVVVTDAQGGGLSGSPIILKDLN
jgi:hypothetical protein